MTQQQIDSVIEVIDILRAWIEPLEFRLRHCYVGDEKPLQNEIANYRVLILNLKSVLEISKCK